MLWWARRTWPGRLVEDVPSGCLVGPELGEVDSVWVLLRSAILGVALVALDELANRARRDHVVDGPQHRVVPSVVLARLQAVATPVHHLAACL